MRVLIQRVSSASVCSGGQTVGAIEQGVVAFVAFTRFDGADQVNRLARKVANLRIFADRQGRLQFSVLDISGGVLTVPQFTLYANTNRGRRPDFTDALSADDAQVLFGRFVDALGTMGIARIESGRFGADMQVKLLNDGPLTIMLEA